MSFVHTFTGVLAPTRSDNIPWVSVLIYESLDRDVDWDTLTPIQTIAWSDADPATAEVTGLTTNAALHARAWYAAEWVDGNGAKSGKTTPLYADIESSGGILPAISAVGALIRTRTKTSGGQELGTFTDDTRPTDEAVSELIGLAAEDVSTVIGTKLPTSVIEFSRAVVALRTAMLVELTYFPEQVSSQRSAYSAYERMYKDRLGQLEKTILGLAAGNTEQGAIGDDTLAVFAFPANEGGMVGWGTKW